LIQSDKSYYLIHLEDFMLCVARRRVNKLFIYSRIKKMLNANCCLRKRHFVAANKTQDLQDLSTIVMHLNVKSFRSLHARQDPCHLSHQMIKRKKGKKEKKHKLYLNKHDA